MSCVLINRVSELRVVELLDGLCEKMQDYTLQEVKKERKKEQCNDVTIWFL